MVHHSIGIYKLKGPKYLSQHTLQLTDVPVIFMDNTVFGGHTSDYNDIFKNDFVAITWHFKEMSETLQHFITL